MPEDVQAVFPWVAAHRLTRASGQGAVRVEDVREFLETVPVPL